MKTLNARTRRNVLAAGAATVTLAALTAVVLAATHGGPAADPTWAAGHPATSAGPTQAGPTQAGPTQAGPTRATGPAQADGPARAADAAQSHTRPIAVPTPIVGGPGGPPDYNDYNQLSDEQTGLCMAPAGDAASLNDGIVQAFCDLDQATMWDLLVNPDNSLEISNDLTHLCLSPAGGSTASGTPIVQYRCDGDPSRDWTSSRVGAGTLRFQNVHSGLCLTEAGGASPGALLVQASCDFANASTGWYESWGVEVGNVASGLCAWWTVNDLNMEVMQNPCNVTRTFRLLVNGAGQGYLRENDYHQFCLSPAGGSMAAGTPIVQYYCDNDASRQWVVVAAGSGRYAIRDLHSALCLAPAGRSTAAGAVLVQDPCDGNASTLWTLTPARVLPQG